MVIIHLLKIPWKLFDHPISIPACAEYQWTPLNVWIKVVNLPYRDGGQYVQMSVSL